MVNVEKRVFKRKLKKLQDAAKLKKPKCGDIRAEVMDDLVSYFYFCF